MKGSQILGKMITMLPSVSCCHSRETSLYDLMRLVARKEVEGVFSGKAKEKVSFDPFGDIVFPYHKMGAVDSLSLFNMDELIIFSFYWINRKRYKNVADIGANIGLHSIIMSKCGFNVRCFEPDPATFQVLKRNLRNNKCSKVIMFNAAVSSKEGQLEFVRVLGNITGSHIAGSKADPYGKLQRFPVHVTAIKPIIEWADLIKIDAEGHEKEIILATARHQWRNTDAIIEVENKNNADALYSHFKRIGLNMFVQKLNWQKAARAQDMPAGYKEGSLFVTIKKTMPWGA